MARRDQCRARQPCPEGATQVEHEAFAARNLGHEMWVATVQRPDQEWASLLVFCNKCGAYTQGCHTRSRLESKCSHAADNEQQVQKQQQPSRSRRGLEILRGLHQGRHPKWKDAVLSSLAPMCWDAEAQD